MSFSNGPVVTTNGLVLSLDAGDRNSYVSGSTTWFDLAGTNNGTLTNGPTFNTGSFGSIVLDGTDDYIQTTATNLNADIGTLNLWIKTGFASTDTRPYYFIDTRDNTNSNNISVYYWQGGGGFVVWSGSAGTIISLTKTFSVNTYFMVTLIYNFVSDNYALYLNGNLENSSTTSASSSGAMTKTTLGSRFNQAASEYFVGNIYSVQAYNRALSASEVQQNYNALKGRFGL